MNLYSLTSVNKETFEDFRKWLYEKLNKNANSFKNFFTYPSKLQIPYFIEYLEYKQIPILEALCYYNYKANKSITFEELCIYTITLEFKRIEEKQIINYTPF